MQVIVEFVGGPWDGQASFQFPLQGREHPDHVLNAAGFYMLTRGELGALTNNMSPANIQMLAERGPEAFVKRSRFDCIYQVVRRSEESHSLFIRAEFRHQANVTFSRA